MVASPLNAGLPLLSRLLQPGIRGTPKCKIRWDLVYHGPTCIQELGSTTAICAPILAGDICHARSPTFRVCPTFRGEAAIFAHMTEQTGVARNSGNT